MNEEIISAINREDAIAAGSALADGALLHEARSNAGAEPVEMTVEHQVVTIQQHRLVGHCPTCGEEISTMAQGAMQEYEQGREVGAQCKCGQRLNVPGRSKLIKPKDMGKIVTPGVAMNRHARRAAGKR